jgi:hypothetical protein
MKVQMTADLRRRLLQVGHEPDLYLQEFTSWQRLGGGDNDHYWFGKDGAYDQPRSALDERVLRHVHLSPDEESPEAEKWDRAWERHSRRTSDTILIYADGGRHGLLLIAINWAPDGHAIAQMKTTQARHLMEGFVAVAERFVFDGTFDV